MQYIGKDVAARGALLHLNRDIAWKRLRSRAKQGIRKARRAGIRVEESRDLALMASVWYDPDTLTDRLTPEQKMYLAYVEDELVGGIIVTPISPNTLFYHYGGTNERGRSIEANAYLFWHVVDQFHDSSYEYLDVGVSFRSELQHYFQKYATETYPILFHPPAENVRPIVRIHPFSAPDFDAAEQQIIAINTQLMEYFDSEFTYLPSWEFAVQSAIIELNGQSGVRIGVWSSMAEKSYVEELKSAFGDVCEFVRRDENADVFIVCHRWGDFCPEIESLSSGAVPVIEDCRDSFYHGDDNHGIGSYGKLAVFDFARWFPTQFGAAMVGVHRSDREVWDKYHCLDEIKRNGVREALQIHWPQRRTYGDRRLENWKRYADLFGQIGMKPVPDQPLSPPPVFVLKTLPPYDAASVHERLKAFGVSTEVDAEENLIAFPCHGQLGFGQIEYVFGAFRGMVNPCHTYIRPDPAETPIDAPDVSASTD